MRSRPALTAILVSVVFLSVAAQAAADFRSVANRIEDDYHLSRTWIPFLGMGRLFVRAIRPNGIHDLKLAVFEDERARFVDVAEILGDEIGPDWQPIVRAKSRDEETIIYARPSGKVMRLIIVAQESDELVVMEVAMDPRTFAESMREPEGIVGRLR
jgi:hypothetical protein